MPSKNDDSSLCYDAITTHQKNLQIYKFDDFSSDIDFNSKTDIFSDVISLIINQSEPRRPKGASSGHKVSASRAKQARLFVINSI